MPFGSTRRHPSCFRSAHMHTPTCLCSRMSAGISVRWPCGPACLWPVAGPVWLFPGIMLHRHQGRRPPKGCRPPDEPETLCCGILFPPMHSLVHCSGQRRLRSRHAASCMACRLSRTRQVPCRGMLFPLNVHLWRCRYGRSSGIWCPDCDCPRLSVPLSQLWSMPPLPRCSVSPQKVHVHGRSLSATSRRHVVHMKQREWKVKGGLWICV